MNRHLPVLLRMESRRCVVVGGGTVAVRRAKTLLEAGANVFVVAPDVCQQMRDLVDSGRVECERAHYKSSAVNGAFLVVAATNDPSVNESVARDAQERGILLNDADDPDRGDLSMPAVVRRGDLAISVATGDAGPFSAVAIRDEISANYGPEYATYLEILGAARRKTLASVDDSEMRRDILRRLAADAAILELIREGRVEEARDKAFGCISSSLD